jgi:hypothetical protein
MLRFTNVDQKPTRLPPVYGYKTHPLLPLRQALDPIIPRIQELDQFIKIAKNACHFPSEHGLTRDESAAIYLYTMDWGEQSLFRELNKVLRIEDRSVLIPWYGYLKLFDTAVQKLPNCQMNLWRGLNVNVSKNFKEGHEVIWWTLNSCSSSLKVVEQFLGPSATLFMIEAKNGKDISAYSNFPQEKEVILGLGTRLRIASNALSHSSLNVVHLLELSDDNEEELSSTLKGMSVTQSKKTTTGK